jgi:dUTP pyrophosphatase
MSDTGKVEVKVKKLSVYASVPEYKKPGDAGADVEVVPNEHREYLTRKDKEDGRHVIPGAYVMQPGETRMLPLGFAVEIPEGWEIQVRSRSGLSTRGLIVANSPGTIDSGYRGPCMVIMKNASSTTKVVAARSRVAQFVLKRAPQAEFVVVNELSDSERAEGGFGSTGVQ